MASKPKMQISLKSTLIVLGLLGAIIGLSGRLYRTEPELFLQIFRWALLCAYIAMVVAPYFLESTPEWPGCTASKDPS